MPLKEAQSALFSNGFLGVKNRRAHRYGCFVKRHSGREADLSKTRLLAPHIILNEGLPPEFQTMVANGQLEAPIATVELLFEVGDITFREKFIVMTNLTSPLIGLLFLHCNSTILDMRQGNLNFPFFSMQMKNEDRTYPNVIEPYTKPSRSHTATGKTNNNLGKVTDLHR